MSTRAEELDQTNDGTPRSHAGGGETGETEEKSAGGGPDGLPISAPVAAHATVLAGSNTGDGVETFTGELGTGLDLVCCVHEGGEGVGEVDAEKTADDVGNTEKIGDGSADDEGDNPVEGTQGVPEEATALGDDGREVKKLLADFEIDGLHADVEVQEDGDESGHEGEGIRNDLQTSRADNLRDAGIGVLSVVCIDLNEKQLVQIRSAGNQEE